MQAALQGVLDAVLGACRGPLLHPESSPAGVTDAGQSGDPQAQGAHGQAGQPVETAGTPSPVPSVGCLRGWTAPGRAAQRGGWEGRKSDLAGGKMTASWPHSGGDIHPGLACIMASWLNCLL